MTEKQFWGTPSFPPMLSDKDSDLLAQYCESYQVNRSPSARWELSGMLRAISEIYSLNYDQEASDQYVAFCKTKLEGPTRG